MTFLLGCSWPNVEMLHKTTHNTQAFTKETVNFYCYYNNSTNQWIPPTHWGIFCFIILDPMRKAWSHVGLSRSNLIIRFAHLRSWVGTIIFGGIPPFPPTLVGAWVEDRILGRIIFERQVGLVRSGIHCNSMSQGRCGIPGRIIFELQVGLVRSHLTHLESRVG